MTKQHIEELISSGLVTVKKDLFKIFVAVALVIAGVVLFISTSKVEGMSNALQTASYVVGLVFVICGVWMMCTGLDKTIDNNCGECFKKRVFYIKRADIDNLNEVIKQIGSYKDILKLSDGAYRIVTLVSKKSLIMTAYQYVPHEYVSVSEIITAKDDKAEQLLATVMENNA